MKVIRIIRQLAGFICLLLMTATLMPVCYEVWHQRPAFESNIRKVDALLTHAERTMKSTDEAVAQWNTASQKQIEESTGVLIMTNKTLAQIQTLAINSDASLTTLLNQSTLAISQQNQSLLETQEQLRKNLYEMIAATEQLQATLAQADKVISDPRIPEAMASVADSVKQLDGAALDVRLVADKFRDDYLKPVNRAWATIKALVDLGGKAGAISLLK